MKKIDAFPHIFPPIYTNMVAAGEASGTLETVLERLADFMEKQAHLRGKVGGALAYPILMLLLGTGLMTVIARRISVPLLWLNPVATVPGWKHVAVTPVPSSRRASSAVNRMFASFVWP